MVEAVWNDSPSLTVSPPEKSTSNNNNNNYNQPHQLQINYGSQPDYRRESLLSPSTGRRTKQNRSITCEYDKIFF